VWVYLGRGVATNALPRSATLPHFLSIERDTQGMYMLIMNVDVLSISF